MSHLRLAPVALLCLVSIAPALAQRPDPPLPEGIKAHRNLEYVPGGHERQKLDLYVPEKAESPLPLVVWVHGGAWSGGSKEGAGPALALLGRGYAVASINYRFSQHAIYPAQLEDCKAAIRWLKANAKTYGYDPARIGVWGASAGGHLVALLGTTADVKELEGKQGPLDQSSRVQAVVDFFGPTDFTQMGGSHNNATSPESKLLGGAVQESKEQAARANPITYATADDPPFLILHGDKDPAVPFTQSELLVDALRKVKVPVTLHRLEGAGHGGPQFQTAESRKLVEEFLDGQLKTAK